MDTAPAAALLPGSPPQPPSLPQAAPAAEPQWHFALGNQQLGPVAQSRLQQMWIDREIGDDTLVWREGMTSWVPITEVVAMLGKQGPTS